LVSYGFSFLSPCYDKIEAPLKAVVLMLAFSAVLLMSLEIGARSKKEDWLMLRDVSFYIICFALIFCVLEMSFPGMASSDRFKYHIEGKYSGLFDEPSHLAFSLFPCFAILFTSSRKSDQLKGIFTLIFVVWISQSATFYQILVLWILYRIVIMGYVKQGVHMLGAIAVALIVASAVNYQAFVYPFIKRFAGVIFPDAKTGLSSLVYLKGWQDAFANIWRTNGLGLGLNMMGCDPLPETSVRDLFVASAGRSTAILNDTNGSFLLSKMLSEMGVFGLVAFAGMIFYLLKISKSSRVKGNVIDADVYTIQASLVFGFLMTVLVRSTNYYQGLVFLFAMSVASYVSLQKATKA